ncbi:MAG: GH92 family glycosyl hydrolase [Muribaculaceae bacterium]|nr:GH92 family glycosyl hydrolase [Muribaculaceae bacterium]
MKNNSFLLSALLLIAGACGHNGNIPPTSKVNFVDPKIGSGGHGHVFVGANVPYGMVQAGPTSLPQAWDWTSGYHDSDSTVIGFSQTHLSGTGIGDLFDITIMPVTGEVTYARGSGDDYSTGLWSYADRSKEITRPGYYSVPLTRYGILAETTATNRVGVHRFTFPEAENPAVVFDLMNGGCWDRPVETRLDSISPTRVAGVRKSRGWAADQKVYFVADFSQPFTSISRHGLDDMFSRVNFPATTDNTQIVVKVGISPNSIEKAEANLRAEASSLSFEDIAAQASQQWEKELAKIDIETDDPEELKKFYTALYHLSVHPSTFNDVDETPQYTILSLWDTYRTQMPLLTILDPGKEAQIVNSMLDIYDRQGRLPVWHLWGNETDCMVGNPGIIVVADAVSKSLPGVDKERALNAMIVTSNDTARGGGYRQRYGYIPFDVMEESIGYDLEYAIADAAIANAAKSMGKYDIAAEYEKRSKSYKNYFDPSTGFMRGKDSKGEWRTPFDPSFSSRGNDYTEGNAWQYTWLVPHDFEGLQELFGGKEQMMTHLDSLFVASSEMVGDDITPDITGMIGQYVQGNEPSHHIVYFYSMAGEREKAANLINQILEEQYSAEPDGLSGNEDAGQMSAWYIMSSLGFYPVEPALPRYWIGVPRYAKATINLPENKYFTVIKGEKGSEMTLNGKPLDRNYITHEEIMNGGELVIPVFN